MIQTLVSRREDSGGAAATGVVLAVVFALSRPHFDAGTRRQADPTHLVERVLSRHAGQGGGNPFFFVMGKLAWDTADRCASRRSETVSC